MSIRRASCSEVLAACVRLAQTGQRLRPGQSPIAACDADGLPFSVVLTAPDGAGVLSALAAGPHTYWASAITEPTVARQSRPWLTPTARSR